MPAPKTYCYRHATIDRRTASPDDIPGRVLVAEVTEMFGRHLHGRLTATTDAEAEAQLEAILRATDRARFTPDDVVYLEQVFKTRPPRRVVRLTGAALAQCLAPVDAEQVA